MTDLVHGFTDALPTTPEQWVAALVTLALAIIGLFRKRPNNPPNVPPND